MKSELRNLLVFVAVFLLAVVLYGMDRTDTRHTPDDTPKTAVMLDAPLPVHPLLSGAWHGRSRVASFLQQDLESRVSIAAGEGGSAQFLYEVGTKPGGHPKPVLHAQVSSTDKSTEIKWTAPGIDYRFKVDLANGSGQLFITKENSRYLVNMVRSDEAAPTGAKAVLLAGRDIAQETVVFVGHRALALGVLYALIAGACYWVFWVLLKKRLSHRKIQASFPRKERVTADMVHSAMVVLAMALSGFLLVMVFGSGYGKVYKDISQYGWAYWGFSLVLLLVLVDLYTFWTHWAMHSRLLFPYFHKVHHMSVRPTPWTTFSINITEVLVYAVFVPIVILALPLHRSVIFLFTFLTLSKNVTSHLGYEIFPKGATKHPLLKWIVTPTFHEMHHMHFRCNYGIYFTWWDKLMKTEHRQYGELFDEVKARQSGLKDEPVKPESAKAV